MAGAASTWHNHAGTAAGVQAGLDSKEQWELRPTGQSKAAGRPGEGAERGPCPPATHLWRGSRLPSCWRRGVAAEGGLGLRVLTASKAVTGVEALLL